MTDIAHHTLQMISSSNLPKNFELFSLSLSIHFLLSPETSLISNISNLDRCSRVRGCHNSHSKQGDFKRTGKTVKTVFKKSNRILLPVFLFLWRHVPGQAGGDITKLTSQLSRGQLASISWSSCIYVFMSVCSPNRLDLWESSVSFSLLFLSS